MSNFIDLTGQQFGLLKVIEYKGKSRWLCECQCKNNTIKIVHSFSLRSGATTSCGCLRKIVNTTTKLEDLTGQQFGEWKVLEYANKSYWLCECQCSLHTRKKVKAQSLKSGKSKSCGHNTTKFEDLTNKQFGNWRVVEYHGNQKWKCQCSCDNHTIKIIDAYNLKSGISRSCGCSKYKSSKLIDLENQKFGELTVINYIGNNKWKCKCSCGNESVHYGHNLRRSNNTISCGCKELHLYTKDEILDKINQFTLENKIKPFPDDLCAILDRSISSVRRYINRYNLTEYLNNFYRSKNEYELHKLFNTNYINYRGVINGELDLYYPEYKLAIEFNGNYWHSEIYKDKYYHQQKTVDCAKKGIQLIHIFEYEWDSLEKREKIIKLLNRKLGKTILNKVYAKNTYVKQISKDNAIIFLNKYHLDNGCNANYYFGCFHNNSNELIGIMSFNKLYIDNTNKFELIQLCWKDDVSVIGGTQKIFKYFTNKFNVQSVITHVDVSKFTGNVYTQLGFKSLNNKLTEPNYIWWDYINNKVIHECLEYESNKTIYKYKIYNSGNLILTWKDGE